VAQETRKRGAPRRGPYGGKTRSFATKLTERTMARLEQQANDSNMSISQTAEAVIVRGLDAQDHFQKHFAPALHAFETGMLRSLPINASSSDLKAWSESAEKLIGRLSRELEHGVDALLNEHSQSPPPTPVQDELDPSKSSEKPPKRLGKRVLDVGD